MSTPRTLPSLRSALRVALVVVLLGGGAAAGAIDAPTNDAEAELLLRQAEEAVQRGALEEALQRYRALVEGGYGTADVWFNIGTLALRAGHTGEAVLALERAVRLDPSDADARANLEVARARNVDELVGAAGGPPFFERLARALPPRPVVWGFAAAWVALFTGLLLARLRPKRWVRVLTALSLVAVLLLGSASLLVIWYREASDEAVVMADAAEVKAGPGPDFDTAFEIHEGLIVKIVDREGPYLRVRLANGLEGWVPSRSVARIWPPEPYRAPEPS
ncbi:MAG: tetratricopeptide repeat protein [Deltaproteobacteria bacterium]|nr:MAG: tetratricopeptide repeat protein [Deltaproteobacteria bacterium]